MNFTEAVEGAESHYERGEYIEAISLVLIGFARLVQEQEGEPATTGWTLGPDLLGLRWNENNL